MAISTRGFALPKPQDKPRRSGDAVKVLPGGRERCLDNAAGRRLYAERRHAMWERQKGLCGICHQWIPEGEETFEHSDGRTAGHRDDRIVNELGEEINCAAHGWCNGLKGSKRQ